MEINYSGKSVLIVDNKLSELGALRQILEQLGVKRIQVASSVNMALSLMRVEVYDLCFVDYDLGRDEKNGLQLLLEANSEKLLSRSNLFVLVVDTERSHLLFGSLENSPDTYISKPYDLVSVRARLDKVMRVKHVTEAIDRLMDNAHWQEALEQCDRISSMFPGLHLYLNRMKGIILLQLGQYAEAVELFESLIERRELPWAEVGLGSAFYHLGRYDDALKMLNRVVENEHLCVEAFSWLGRAYWAKGALQQAITLMRKAVMLQPTSPQLQRELADLAAQAEDWNIAIDSYRSAIRYGRNSIFQEPSSYFGLARALAHKMSKVREPEELEGEVIRLLEDVVLDHQGFEEVGLSAKLCGSDVFRIGKVEGLSEQRMRDAWAMFQQLETDVQCAWLDAVVDASNGSPLANEISEKKKALANVMVTLTWGKANLKAMISFRKGELNNAYKLFREAHRLLPTHVGIALNLVQTGIELARRVNDNAEILLCCDMVLAEIRFGELSVRQQTRFRSLAQRCAGMERHVPEAG